MAGATDEGFFTRGVVVALDPTPAQERLLRSYSGMRLGISRQRVRQIDPRALHKLGNHEGSSIDLLFPS